MHCTAFVVDPGHVDDTTGTALPAQARAELADALADAELRPALLTEYAPETLRAYRKRYAHYAAWAVDAGFQPRAEAISADTIDAYVRAQIELGELRPSVIHQALNALTYYAERSGGRAPDIRQAREAVRKYRNRMSADGVPPAYRVTREVHRPRRGRRSGTA